MIALSETTMMITGVVGWLVVLVVVLALCRAAKRGDEMMRR